MRWGNNNYDNKKKGKKEKKQQQQLKMKDTAEKHQMDESGSRDTDGQIRSQETVLAGKERWVYSFYMQLVKSTG